MYNGPRTEDYVFGTNMSPRWDAQEVGAIISTSTEMIQLRVDDDKIDPVPAGPFQPMVHKDLLCLFSPYYNAALRGQFSEAKEETIRLELNTLGARIFVTWLYTGKVLHYCESELLPVYVFADQTDILALRRDLMDFLVEFRFPSWWNVTLVISSIPESSGLWRWLVDGQIHHFKEEGERDEDLDAQIEGLPKTFLYDIMRGLAGKPTQNDQTKCPCCSYKDSCKYHEHKDLIEWKATCGLDEKYKQPADCYFKYLKKT